MGETFANSAFLWRFAKVKTNLESVPDTATCQLLAFQRTDSIFGPVSMAVPLSIMAEVKQVLQINPA